MNRDTFEEYMLWGSGGFSSDSGHIGLLRIKVLKEHATKDPDLKTLLLFMNSIEGNSHPIRQKIRDAAIKAHEDIYTNTMNCLSLNVENLEGIVAGSSSPYFTICDICETSSIP